ncbi:MAG: hypothetical protein VSS52_005640, partial [Thiotrichaceae bacterium]|nr:hypothetical protein [Thiotrichaceae bacterium]
VEFPEGLEDLTQHNLLTYKSIHEPLNEWAIDELIGHYVNYRKQESISLNNLLPTNNIKLYAVCTRFPSNLQKQGLQLIKQQAGVFNLIYGSHQIKMLVLGQMPQKYSNAIWQLFSGKSEGFVYGGENYNWHSVRDKAILNQLYEFYKQKGAVMPYTMDDFVHDYVSENLHVLSAEEVLQKYSPEKRLEGLSVEEILQKLPPDKIEAFLKNLKK